MDSIKIKILARKISISDFSSVGWRKFDVGPELSYIC
jgi:hypothetical protein